MEVFKAQNFHGGGGLFLSQKLEKPMFYGVIRMFKKSKNKGFSLVELIVIIAILAVFAAILVPSLLQYTENSRAQKDESAMDEVVNAVQLALADEKCFDEALKYSCTNNYLTYSDSSGNYGQQINDGEFWAPDGSGRATTITFNPEYGPNNQIIYDLSKGIVNDMTYGNGSVGQDRIMQGAQITDNQCYLSKLPQVYNTVRQTVGTDIITTSQTYRNSSFTIFIKFNQKDSTTVADVSGSFNGTNLYEGANAASGSGTSEYDSNGDAITTITTPSSSAPNYTASSLSGTGSFGGSSNINNNIADYQQPTYIENIQKENKCYYYSTLKKAVDDVNNNTMGQNGDSTKDDAVAFVYTENATNYVVLLKDHETRETITVTNNLILTLGGKKLSGYNRIINLTATDKTITIDGRISGSIISAIQQDDDQSAICVYSYGTLIMNGGKYEAIVSSPSAKVCVIASNGNGGSATINNVEIVCDGIASRIHGIQCAPHTTINNCNITLINRKQSSATATQDSQCDTRALFPTQGAYTEFNNSTIKVLGNDGRFIDTDGLSYWTGALGIYALKDATFVVKNCNISASVVGIQVQNRANVSAYNTTITGGSNAVTLTSNDASPANNYGYFENCDLIVDKSLSQVSLSTRNKGALLANYSSVQMHNCIFASNNGNTIYVQNGSDLKLSQCQLGSLTFSVSSDSKVYIGARNSVSASTTNNGTTIIFTNEVYQSKN